MHCSCKKTRDKRLPLPIFSHFMDNSSRYLYEWFMCPLLSYSGQRVHNSWTTPIFKAKYLHTIICVIRGFCIFHFQDPLGEWIHCSIRLYGICISYLLLQLLSIVLSCTITLKTLWLKTWMHVHYLMYPLFQEFGYGSTVWFVPKIS